METHLYAVDVETSGLDPLTCSILSIGAVEIGNPARTFYEECRPFPDAEIHDEALAINGFTRNKIASQPLSEALICGRFSKWLKSSPIMVAHNSSFDSSFIKAAMMRAHLPNPFSFRTIDIHSIVYMHILRNALQVPKKLSLNECLQYFNLPPEPMPHIALTGAQMNEILFEKVKNFKG